jgi:fatty acid desaturase
VSASAVKTSQSTTPKKGSHYAKSSVELRRDLAKALPQELVKELHKTEPWKHFLVLGWQFLLLAVGVTGAVMVDRWLLWLPFSIVIGFTIFNFTVMLHEVVHDAVFTKKRRPFAQKVLGWLYAFPSGISRSQFTRWHLDHHAELGDDEADPKRHHLSPKKHARWYKFLYMTPALIPIYFRGAKRETATYPEDLQKQIRFERTVTVVGQLAILASIVVFAGWWIAFKVYLVPVLFVFPVAFTLNRLGQHYNINPDDPAQWSSLMKPSRFWDTAFLWSNYHLEHHYFPRVPFYKLRRLHMALRPFYEARGMKPTTYSSLLYNWFVLNRTPHTDWSADRQEGTG